MFVNANYGKHLVKLSSTIQMFRLNNSFLFFPSEFAEKYNVLDRFHEIHAFHLVTSPVSFFHLFDNTKHASQSQLDLMWDQICVIHLQSLHIRLC